MTPTSAGSDPAAPSHRDGGLAVVPVASRELSRPKQSARRTEKPRGFSKISKDDDEGAKVDLLLVTLTGTGSSDDETKSDDELRTALACLGTVRVGLFVIDPSILADVRFFRARKEIFDQW